MPTNWRWFFVALLVVGAAAMIWLRDPFADFVGIVCAIAAGMHFEEITHWAEDVKKEKLVTKEEIGKGLERAQQIYEGWKLDELLLDQLYEAIVQANR